MGIEDYRTWVKEVNLEAAKVDKCLSCFTINGDTLKEYYQEGDTPFFTVVRLMLGNHQKDICLCEQRGLK